ncbi:MAG: signal peptidase II [Planctomycetaceae bacterium]|jgi:signal peptidase II|nr:signal peptidase II [Planctomycetaceae bacterium]
MKSVPASRQLLFWVIVIATCGWDLYSKHTVFTKLGFPDGISPWVKTFFNGGVRYRQHTTFNHGALWGVGQGLSLGFAALSLVAVVAVLYWLFIKGHAKSLWLTLSLASIMGGTLGNLYDRLALHGCRNAAGDLEYAVRDFLRFELWGYHWPVFNYADVFLVTGAGMLFVYSLLYAEEHEEANSSKESSNVSPDSEESLTSNATST